MKLAPVPPGRPVPIQPIYVFAEKLKSCHQLVNRDHVLVHAAALRTGGRIVVARLLLLAVAAAALVPLAAVFVCSF